MKSPKFWIAVLAAGIAMNLIDFLVQGIWLNSAIYSQLPETFNMTTNPLWYIFGDFVAVFVFVWVYDRVYGSFGGATKGGALYGLYAGILVNFPTWIFLHLFIRGYSYSLAWISTAYGIVWGVAAGAIVGAIYKKVAASGA